MEIIAAHDLPHFTRQISFTGVKGDCNLQVSGGSLAITLCRGVIVEDVFNDGDLEDT